MYIYIYIYIVCTCTQLKLILSSTMSAQQNWLYVQMEYLDRLLIKNWCNLHLDFRKVLSKAVGAEQILLSTATVCHAESDGFRMWTTILWEHRTYCNTRVCWKQLTSTQHASSWYVISSKSGVYWLTVSCHIMLW